MSKRADFYQIALIITGLIVTAFFAVFLYREIFPEYKLYQNDYVALEDFRATYTHQAAPTFKMGVKQIVIEREDKGPPVIDRCTSCHVALQIPYFSPTKVAYDLNGNVIQDGQGQPLLVNNEDYIWNHLDQKIAELRDKDVLAQLEEQGQTKEVQNRLKQADQYEALKIAKVGEHTYDVTKVLAMHPLMGKETRPFEYHPLEEYGCTSCHSGNGRGLTTEKAHGPVFDGQYEIEDTGHTLHFTEKDPQNDPLFAKEFNNKPGHHLLFQTTPIFVGALIQAKCMQCHQTSQMQLATSALSTSQMAEKKQKQFQAVEKAFEKDKQALLDLLALQIRLLREGLAKTEQYLKEQSTNYEAPDFERAASQLQFLKKASKKTSSEQLALKQINQQLLLLLGSQDVVDEAKNRYAQAGEKGIAALLKEQTGTGVLFVKGEALDYQQDLLRHAQETQHSFQSAVDDQKTMQALTTDVDELTRHYQSGKELFLSQACYACHRISGLARGGVGPELTQIGTSYPWYIKQSIVWPQADLPSSTMPNMRLDHKELEDLMAFLLAQRGDNQAVAQTAYKAALQSWEGGRKLPWEKPVSPAQMHDLRYSMTVFATEGCAACHRLMGFDSNVGFKIEKENPSFEQLYTEQQWFKKLFPETVRLDIYDEPLPGSSIVSQIEKHASEIDAHIAADVRQDSILEEIEKSHPQAVEGLYSNFRYASRAKDHYYSELIQKESDPLKRTQIEAQAKAWKARVRRVLMMFIQQYGFGRLIGPRPNWSGIYRTDEWLMEHFRNPSAHVPRSIMPVMPFDDTKFYALTYLLDVLAPRNRDAVRQIWTTKGFDPAEAYQVHCMQCHGQSLAGNGPVSEWIYPIPKSLRNLDFLHNLTRERVAFSIMHGIKGTPMPPFGEVAPDKPQTIQKLVHQQPVLTADEIHRLVDWLFTSLPSEASIEESQDVLKWRYGPKDVLQELQKEGGYLQSLPTDEHIKQKDKLPERELPQENVAPPREESVTSFFPTAEGYYAAIRPEIYPRLKPQNEQQSYQVEDVFDIVPNSDGWPDRNSYYIKKQYYTPYNLQEGQKFFLINCAVCHGNEGDGSGYRSNAMQEAKPRMFINLDWLQSRDDLRLLRSIKYGVPGTSMTPWGDLTNSLQRMQLVMFIRSLSKEQERRQQLEDALYKVFDTAQVRVEEARIAHNTLIEEKQKQLSETKEQQAALEYRLAKKEGSPQEALTLYQKNLELTQQLQTLQNEDEKFLTIKNSLKKERDVYANLGIDLISKDMNEDTLHAFIALILLNQDRYQIHHNHLQLSDANQVEQMNQLQHKLVEDIQNEIDALQEKIKIADAKINSAQKIADIKTLEADLAAYEKIKAKFKRNMAEVQNLMQQQTETVHTLNPLTGTHNGDLRR
jgi:mono/diheme cytochrome c family protein